MFLLLTLLILGSCSEKKQESRDIQPVKVKTMLMGAASFNGGQSYSATIEEMSGTSLSFAGGGTVKSLNVSEGQFVSRRQLIGVIDAQNMRNNMNMASASRVQAEEGLKQAQDAYDRMKKLYDNGSLTEMKWVEVQTQLSQAQQAVRQAKASEQIAKKSLTDTRLYAPFSGYVAEKSVEIGANVAPGMSVIKLVKIDNVKVKMSVPEEEISNITKGQKIQVSVGALPGKRYTATVTEKGVSADPLSRSYEVKAVIPNPRHELLPGMVATVQDVVTVTRKERITVAIPATIVQIDADNQPFVWTVVDGKAQKTPVSLGANVGNDVVITQGLNMGDKVIVEGQQKVSSGMQVKE